MLPPIILINFVRFDDDEDGCGLILPGIKGILGLTEGGEAMPLVSHALWICSPHRPGFPENDDALKRISAVVAGISPESRLLETFRYRRLVWLKAGMGPVNELSCK